MERHFDQQLDDLKAELLKMGSAVEKPISRSVAALVERDDGLVAQVIYGGKRIDDWEVQIEDECLKLIATHQPVASDLRLLATIRKIDYDLERINDEAVNIAQRAQVLNRMPILKALIDIPCMADLAEGRIVRHPNQKWWGNVEDGPEPEGGERE